MALISMRQMLDHAADHAAGCSVDGHAPRWCRGQDEFGGCVWRPSELRAVLHAAREEDCPRCASRCASCSDGCRCWDIVEKIMRLELVEP